jgi:hypothetical protein
VANDTFAQKFSNIGADAFHELLASPCQSCYSTNPVDLAVGPTGATYFRLTWSAKKTGGIKLSERFAFGMPSSSGEVEMQMANDTCNTYGAPEPSPGTTILHTDLICAAFCPATLSFSGKVREKKDVEASTLVPTAQYQVYAYSNGRSTPTEVINARTLSSKEVRFATPFVAPFEFETSQPIFVEIVQP